MAKSTRNFVCQSCGAVANKWAGKCDSCNEWNCMAEEITEAKADDTRARRLKTLIIDSAAGRKIKPLSLVPKKK